MKKTKVWSLGEEDALEEEMATHSSILAWRIPMDRGAWQATVRGVAKSCPEWLNSSKDNPFWVTLGKIRPGGPFRLYLQLPCGPCASSFSAAAGTPVMGLWARTCTPVGWAAWEAECLCGTFSLHPAFVTWIEGPVPHLLSPLSSTVTWMWRHFSLLEHCDKKGGVRAWQHLSECCKYLFEILV